MVLQGNLKNTRVLSWLISKQTLIPWYCFLNIKKMRQLFWIHNIYYVHKKALSKTCSIKGINTFCFILSADNSNRWHWHYTFILLHGAHITVIKVKRGDTTIGHMGSNSAEEAQIGQHFDETGMMVRAGRLWGSIAQRGHWSAKL